MNIVIIGMRGTGKTTIGKMLSNALKRPYIETDALVVKKTNQSIVQIVAEHGWNYFRDLESAVIGELASLNNCVIATGGGVVTRDYNVALLKKNSMIILLTASVETMTIRLRNDSKRPSLTDKQSLRDEIIHVLEERRDQYRTAADIVVATDDQDPSAIVKTILETIHI